ncbi:MAG: NUDIX hydrolase [Candidatus Diapherotrites archaeon]|uniref:NUDIX hydrolase n=1 Tax=Candidatus Iainarchaeum sp. TaxID=3101447 RepID=A0A8T4KS00_9ARCH|nr:NUDIX hydrolase [Candidatus Diapherotrites archaeon]
MDYEKSAKLHIVSVVAVIPNKDGKILVLKRSDREIAYPGLYTFPGGKIENNDTIEETLIKEVKEEAGLVLKPGKILLKDKAFTRPDGQTVKVFSYLCFAENPESIKIDKNDFTDFKWISLQELKQLRHVGIEEEFKKAEELLNLKISFDELSTKSAKE